MWLGFTQLLPLKLLPMAESYPGFSTARPSSLIWRDKDGPRVFWFPIPAWEASLCLSSSPVKRTHWTPLQWETHAKFIVPHLEGPFPSVSPGAYSLMTCFLSSMGHLSQRKKLLKTDEHFQIGKPRAPSLPLSFFKESSTTSFLTPLPHYPPCFFF